MLNKPIDEIVFDEEGKVAGVRSGEEVARAPDYPLRSFLCTEHWQGASDWASYSGNLHI